MTTTTTATVHRTSWTRRRLAVVAGGALVAGLGALAGAGTGRASTPSPTMLCSARPAADAMPFGPALLLSTVRVVDGTAEVLHAVTCGDGPTSYEWFSAADLGRSET
jgi:hypothetical protein